MAHFRCPCWLAIPVSVSISVAVTRDDGIAGDGELVTLDALNALDVVGVAACWCCDGSVGGVAVVAGLSVQFGEIDLAEQQIMEPESTLGPLVFEQGAGESVGQAGDFSIFGGDLE